MTARRTLTLLLIASGLAACAGERWALTATNDVGSVLVIRVTTSTSQRSWLIRQGDHLILLSESAPVVGTLELVDPQTCEVYDRDAIPETPTLIDPGDLDAVPPDYELGLVLGEAVSGLGAQPNFDGC